MNDGSIERAGRTNRTMIVPPVELQNSFISIVRMANCIGRIWKGCESCAQNLDGLKVETLARNGQGDEDRRDQMKWCVGITVDPDRGQFYWTQKGPDDAGKGRIFRASTEIPKGQSPENRTDVEVLFEGLPEPIDLELDLYKRVLLLDRSWRSSTW